MNIQDELTQAIAEAAKGVLGKSKKESLKDYKPTRGGSKQDDFIDLHTINVEEGNEFTKAAAKAKLAGEDEFEFEGKTYPTEISQDAAEKILGKSESMDESLLQKVKDKLQPKKAKAREALAKLSKEIEKKEDDLEEISREERKLNYTIKRLKKELPDADPEDKEEMLADIEDYEVELDYYNRTDKDDPGAKMEIRAEIDKIKAKMKEISTKFKVRTPTKESVEEAVELEEEVDNFFGFPTKDKLVKFQSMAKKLRIKPMSNPTVLKRGGKEFHVMGFKGSVKDIEKAMKAAAEIIKEETLEEAVDNFFGFPTKDKLVQFQSMAKKLKIKPISNPTVLKRGGKEFHVMGFEGSVSDIEKAMKVAADIIKEDAQKKTEALKEFGVNRLAPDSVNDGFGNLELEYRSSSDIRDAEDALNDAGIKTRRSGNTLEIDSKSPAFKKARIDGIMGKHEKARKDAVLKVLGEKVEESVDGRTKEFKEKIKNLEYSKTQEEADVEESTAEYAKSLEKIANDRKLKNISKKDKETLGKIADLLKRANEAISKTEKIEETLEEESVDEAIDPRRFALGGNTKATKRDVDAILSKLFMNAKLAKQVEDSEAYKAGYKSKGKGKNPYKKDTADFQLYILGQQSAQSE